jgi:hypothetical protein
VNLRNCTITGITAPNPPSTGGKVTWPAATPISVRGLHAGITQQQVNTLGQRIKDATAMVVVMKNELPAGVRPGRGYELRFTPDGGAALVTRVEHVLDVGKAGGLSHYQAFVRDLAS